MRLGADTRIPLVTILALALLPRVASLQSKPAVTPPQYAKWENVIPLQAPLSPDGRYLVYAIRRSDRQSEMRVLSLAMNRTTTIPFGEAPVFSADSRFLACLVGFSEEEEARLKKEKKPVHKRLALVRLETGDLTTLDGIEAFAFDADGTHLAMRRYAPERKEESSDEGASSSTKDDEPKPGGTLLVRTLATGFDTTFANVSEFAWQTKGPLLAFAVNSEDRSGNGVHVFSPAAGALRTLDSSSSTYFGPTWRKDADALVVLRSKTDERREGPTHVILAWTQLAAGAGEKREFDPTTVAGFPAGMRAVSYRFPMWTDDGAFVFFGMAPWNERSPTEHAGSSSADSTKTNAGASNTDDELPAVHVWHPKDISVMPRQKIRAQADRQRSLLAAWHVVDGRFTQIAASVDEVVTPFKRTPTALVVDTGIYGFQRSIGRRHADVSLTDLAKGTRTKVKDRLDDQYVVQSPGGRYVLYVQDDHYFAYDVSARIHTNLTKTIATSFVDRESDVTVKQKPTFGIAGWTTDDASVWLYDKWDIWDVKLDGSKAIRLTDGKAEEVRHRYVTLDPEAEWIDPRSPVPLEIFGVWSKKSGLARLHLEGGAPRVERLVWLDKSVGRLAKAKDADTYAYLVQAFDDSPDYFVGDARLAHAKPVTTTNPFMSDVAWGRAELVEYKGDRGERLQAALHYPANYEPGRSYPMVVYMYEKRSDTIHAFSAPSEREPYNAAVFTNRGYFFLQPDIVFRPRDPGVSVVECVLPAVKRVVDKGLVDSQRVGIVGHSWGGFDTVYLAAHTDVFAAAVAGAPITNLVSNYGNHHWSSGIAETDHIETGQQRMQVPLYEDLQAYIRNSAVFGVHRMKTPLLIAFGENDGTVHWHQGVEMYNIGRRAGKQIVMVAYEGEDHSLRKKANQIDYHRRIFEWFDHYLQNRPAPAWIENGFSYLEREKALERMKRSR